MGGTECLKEKCPWYSTEFASGCLVIDGCNAVIAAVESLTRLNEQIKALDALYSELAKKGKHGHR